MVEGARTAVATNVKAALHVPLQEICKVVVEAKCPRVTSLRKLRSTVEGECAKWVRRSEPLGATLSLAMVKRVLGLFVDTDLAACKAQVRAPQGRAGATGRMDAVQCCDTYANSFRRDPRPSSRNQVLEREKEAKRRWARVAFTAVCGLLLPLVLMLLTAGVRIEEVEVEQPVASSSSSSSSGQAAAAAEDGGDDNNGRTGTPRTTTVRRRRISIGNGRLSIGGGTGVTFGGPTGTPVAAGPSGRRASLLAVSRMFSPMK